MDDFLKLDVRKGYDGFSLKLSAELPPGIVAVLGPSGSGKTTLLNCIAGVTTPDAGIIMVGGRTLFDSARRVNLAPERRRIGYMFQDSLLFPHFTVSENIRYGYRLTPRDRRRIDPAHVVDLLELGRLMDRPAPGLSAGERQRVVLARALATSPDLLLLDEPLANLHQGIKGRILRYLKAVRQDLDIPMLYVSHSISEVMALADRALVIKEGRKAGYDEPRRLLGQPSAAELISADSLENLFDVTVAEHRPESGITLAKLGGAVLALPLVDQPVGRTVSVAVRASEALLAAEEPRRISARNILKARVERVHAVGSSVLVHVWMQRPWVVEITPDALAALELKPDDPVYLIVKSSSISLLD